MAEGWDPPPATGILRRPHRLVDAERVLETIETPGANEGIGCVKTHLCHETRVRRNLVGEVINLLREEAEFVDVRVTSDASPDPEDNPFCACVEQARAAFIATLNPKDFPQRKLRAKVISPGDPIPTIRRRDRSGNR